VTAPPDPFADDSTSAGGERPERLEPPAVLAVIASIIGALGFLILLACIMDLANQRSAEALSTTMMFGLPAAIVVACEFAVLFRRSRVATILMTCFSWLAAALIILTVILSLAKHISVAFAEPAPSATTTSAARPTVARNAVTGA
jgi:Trk-type K+ transport system membrane component